ncbi:MAG: hypothetical protein M0R77_00420 [Gammaproteobacteria bacterium]|nr:hypothetical protein [Acholeplasmataceae bacterium]MCK9529018.1 hypothetical protein [Gammaproteobacteria bacterium]
MSFSNSAMAQAFEKSGIVKLKDETAYNLNATLSATHDEKRAAFNSKQQSKTHNKKAVTK